MTPMQERIGDELLQRTTPGAAKELAVVGHTLRLHGRRRVDEEVARTLASGPS